MDQERLREAVDYIEIRRLQSAYADVVTRRAWDELGRLFLPTAEVTIDRRTGKPVVLTGPRGVGEFIASAIERFEFFQFVVLNTHVDIDGDGARARMWMQELRQDREGRWTETYGLYLDRHARVDGRWWFAGRHYHSLARTGSDAVVFPMPPT